MRAREAPRKEKGGHEGMAAGGRYAVAERGLWTSSALTLTNARAAGEMGVWRGELSG